MIGTRVYVCVKGGPTNVDQLGGIYVGRGNVRFVTLVCALLAAI
jgi:hypothetical protein